MEIIMYRGSPTWADEDGKPLPSEVIVCPRCRGKGSHLIDGIREHAYTVEEMDEDPQFFEDYMSGAYDKACDECHGRRVSARLIEKGLGAEDSERLREHYEKAEHEYYDRLESEMELRMGA